MVLLIVHRKILSLRGDVEMVSCDLLLYELANQKQQKEKLYLAHHVPITCQ